MASSIIWKDFELPQRDRYTLRYVLERNLHLCFECGRCRKLAAIDIIAMIDLYGSATTLGELRANARCRRCKSTSAEILLRRDSAYRDFQWWPRPPGATR